MNEPEFLKTERFAAIRAQATAQAKAINEALQVLTVVCDIDVQVYYDEGQFDKNEMTLKIILKEKT